MIRILRVLRVKTRNEGPPPPVHPIPNHMTTQGGVGCVVMWFRMGWLGGGGPLGAAGRRFICPGDQSARLNVGKAPAERGGDGRFACTRSRLNESAWTSHRTYYTRRERETMATWPRCSSGRMPATLQPVLLAGELWRSPVSSVLSRNRFWFLPRRSPEDNCRPGHILPGVMHAPGLVDRL